MFLLRSDRYHWRGLHCRRSQEHPGFTNAIDDVDYDNHDYKHNDTGKEGNQESSPLDILRRFVIDLSRICGALTIYASLK